MRIQIHDQLFVLTYLRENKNSDVKTLNRFVW